MKFFRLEQNKPEAENEGHWLALIFVLIFAYNAEYIVLGPFSALRAGDNYNAEIPLRLALYEHFRHNPLTFFASWYPVSASGTDRLANAHFLFFELPFFILLPKFMAIPAYLLTLHLASAYCVYRILTTEFGTSRAAAAFAAVTFVIFSDPNRQGIPVQVVAAWAPIMLYLFGRLEQRRYGALLAAGMGMLSGIGISYAMVIFGLPFFGLYFLIFRRRRSALLIFACGLAGLILAGTPQILAGAVFSPESARVIYRSAMPMSYANGEFLLSRDIGMFFILPVATAFIAGGSRTDLIRLLSIVLGLHAIDTYVFPFLVSDILKSDSLTVVTPRFQVPSGWLLNALMLGVAANSLQSYMQSRKVFIRPWVFALGIAVLTLAPNVAVKRKTLWGMLHGLNYTSFFKNPGLANLREQTRDAPPYRVATLRTFKWGWPYYSGNVWTHGFETADGWNRLITASYRDFWATLLRLDLKDKAALRDHFKIYVWPVFLWNGHSLASYYCGKGPIDSCEIDISQFANLDLLSLANVKYIISPVPLGTAGLDLINADDARRQEEYVTEPVRVKWIKSFKGEPALVPPLYVYQNSRVLPRAFLVRRVKVLESATGVLEQMRGMSAAELRQTALLAGDDGGATAMAAAISDLDGDGDVTIRHYAWDHLEIAVSTKKSGFLVVTNNIAPDWTATVNGRPTHLFRVDHTFQGVAVPAGTSTVSLTYRPMWSAINTLTGYDNR